MGSLATRFLLLLGFLYSSLAGAVTAVNLTAGWTLLGNSGSTPLDVATQFGDPTKVTSVWKWDKFAAKWIFYTPHLSASDLTTYAQSKGFGVLTSIASKEGYWVNAPVASTVLLTDTPTAPGAPATTLLESDLQVGWNLLASADHKTASQLQAALGTSLTGASKAMSSAWAWDAPSAKWRFYAPSLEAQGGTVLTDYLNSQNYLPFSIPLAATDGFWLNIEPAETYLLKLQSNAAVYDNPPNKTLLSLSKPSHISKLFTYHWNSGNGAMPGTITLKNTATGAVVGTWNVVAMKGLDIAAGASWSATSNGPPYLYWTVQPNIDLAAGTYEVVDSHPATWSYTLDTGSKGIAWVYGWPIIDRPEIVTATIGIDGGTVGTSTMKLVIPPGAVSQAVNVSVASTPASTGSTPLSDVFSITFQGSAGAAFDMLDITQDLQIEIGLKSTLPAGSAEKYFLKISTGGGYSLIPATVTSKTLKATLPGNPVGGQNIRQQVGESTLAAVSIVRQKIESGTVVIELTASSAIEAQSEHFKYFYKSTDNAEVVNTAKTDFEAFYKILEGYGFSWTDFGTCRFDKNTFTPYKMLVYFNDLGGVVDGGVTYGQYGPISILYSPCNDYYFTTYLAVNTNPAALSDPVYRKQIIAHELFHFLQAIFSRNAESFKWIDEASSVWFQYTVANKTTDATRCFSDTWNNYNFTARGLFNPFNSALDVTKDFDAGHGYGVGAFLLYADAKGYFNKDRKIEPLWGALRNKQGEVPAFRALMAKELATVWSEYVEDFYSGADLSSMNGSSCIYSLATIFDTGQPLTNRETTSMPFNFKKNIDMYPLSAVPYMLKYVHKLSTAGYAPDLTFQVKNLLANQKAAVYSYSVATGRTKLGEITSGGPNTFTSKALELKGKIISIILIDTNIPAEASPSATTVVKTNTVEVKVYSPLQIISLDPSSAAAGQSVTVSGTGFGATQLSSTIAFNGVNVSSNNIISWSDASIAVSVPTGTTSGNVVVTVDGAASNGVPFFILRDCINDPSTGLCWDRKDSGDTNWSKAGTYCASRGARLPTIEELVLFSTEGAIQFSVEKFGNSMVQPYLYGTAKDLNPRLTERGYEYSRQAGQYWSSTRRTDHGMSGLWSVYFEAGLVTTNLETANFKLVARCVGSR